MREFLLLGRHHDRNGFDCGEEALNKYLRETARQHVEKGIAKTFVYVDTDNPGEILGYFTLVVCETLTEGLPEKIAHKLPGMAPAARLGRLAVSKKHQGQKIGTLLMAEVIQRILSLDESFGVIGLLVDAKTIQAKKFYAGFGFVELHGRPLKLFLPLQTLRDARN